MDTVTHGIAGALIGKALFRGDDMLALRPMNRGRIVTWALMLGAIFPDSDTFRDIFSHNELLVITWHRSITHSLVCLPLFAVALAALTRWYTRWHQWDAPSFAALTGIYAIGILSHILLDLLTSFGTMIWSPLKWSRPAWDVLFIIDFTFTAIVLVPQILAWVYAKRGRLYVRAMGSWLVFVVATLGVAGIARFAGTPISSEVVVAAILILGGFFLLPAIRYWGLQVSRVAWNFAGWIVALGYIGLAAFNHHAALARVEKFASFEHLEASTIGALPLPPSVWRWDGLVLTPHGVYETRITIGEGPEMAPTSASAASPLAVPLEYHFYPDAIANWYIEAAKRIPEVQAVYWFSRFPVTRFRKEGSEAIVEISDLRFRQIRRDRAPSFTYQVRFSADGSLLSKGWVRW
jgi:membrane-bound metal-dependent hydrolase YbcI (DUF457 family)